MEPFPLVDEVDSQATLKFFFSGLCERVTDKVVSRDETVHVASILASFAQTSRYDPTFLPPLANLSEFFEQFVYRTESLRDPQLLEDAGAQSLYFSGFFRDQMRRRHNVHWYDDIGRMFYERAGAFSQSDRRRRLFLGMARNFPFWTRTCAKLSRDLRESRYLIDLQ